MSNPYQTPSFDPGKFRDLPSYSPPPGNYAGMVQQVRVVSILNIVQGTLEICMGLVFVSMGVIMPLVLANDPAFKRQNADAPPVWLFALIYVVWGSPALISGILRIVAGLQNYRYKSRTLGFVSFILGMVAVFTCYCAPTAIGVLVYGLIVFLNPGVVAAFQLGQEGRTGDEILASFYNSRPSG